LTVCPRLQIQQLSWLEEIDSKILDLDSAFLIAQLRIFIFLGQFEKTNR